MLEGWTALGLVCQGCCFRPWLVAGSSASHVQFSLLQVVPAWPVHTNEPAKQYKAVTIPDFSIDFASYQPMIPQVRLQTPNWLFYTQTLLSSEMLPCYPMTGVVGKLTQTPAECNRLHVDIICTDRMSMLV